MKLKPLPISIFTILIIGVGLGFLLAFRTYIPYLYWGEADNYTWTRYSLPSIINYSLWPFLVPFVYHNSYKWQIGMAFSVKSNCLAVLMCLGFSLLHEIVSNLIYFLPLELMGWYHFDADSMNYLKGAFPAAMINRVVEYWIIVFALRSIDNYQALKKSEINMARIESQLTSAKLKALRMQLQPHFLFNTLNTISSLLDIDKNKARTVITRFGQVLRNVLDTEDQNFISLDKEIESTQNYLSIEKVRFSDRLMVNYDISEKSKELMVPALILQPLVENSIKHGLSKSTEDIQINISSTISEDILILKIVDNGKSEEHSTDHYGNGVGLRNTRDRLESLFGSEASISVRNDDGFQVILKLPKLQIDDKISS